MRDITEKPGVVILDDDPMGLDFWRRHPDVIEAERVGPQIRLAVRPITDEEVAAVEALRKATQGRSWPPRKPDLEYGGGDDEPHPTFWERIPGVERVSLAWGVGEDPAWWGVKVWLRRGFQAGSAAA